jgi:dephospho-CoA kinase
MQTIGLTGGIGWGKSTIAGLLAELGAIIIDADKIGHDLLGTDKQVRDQVVLAFNHRILSTDGSVNRKKLAKIVFTDYNALSRLNQIIHPMIYRVVKTQLGQYRDQESKVVVIEAPLLIEANWIKMVDAIWVVTATKANVLKRFEKTEISHEEIMARIHSQLTDDERIKMADVVIKNNYSFNELKLEVNRLWQDLQFDSHK